MNKQNLNKDKTKLTMQQLKAELEALKTTKTTKPEIQTPRYVSFIIGLVSFLKSIFIVGIIFQFLLSNPYIGPLLRYLDVLYAKTTWWTFLICFTLY